MRRSEQSPAVGRIESINRVQHAGSSTLLATRLTPESRILSDDATPRNGLELEVADFGPIAEAAIELRPLTVFIGPSNTGKSWLAMVIYALHRFMGRALGTGARRLVLPGRMFDTQMEFASDRAVHHAIDELVKTLYRRDAPFDEEISLGSVLSEEMRLALARQAEDLRDEFCRCLGVLEAQALVRKGCEAGATVVVRQGALDLLALRLLGTQATLEARIADDVRIRKDAVRDDLSYLLSTVYGTSQRDDESRDAGYRDALRVLAGQVLPQLFNPFFRQAFYLPAGRTGAIEAYREILGGMADSGRSLLPRVLTDFLRHLIELLPTRNGDGGFDGVASRIETEMLGGGIRVGPSPVPGFPQFGYRPEGWSDDLPLVNSSSAVSELAPVVLFLRHVVAPGDVLIVEEPEAHLHPAAQVELTRLLARTVQGGLRVIITTHSEWILEALANTVRRSGLTGVSSAKETEPGVGLAPGDVGAWLFKHGQSNGSIVERLELDEETGLFPAGYDRVSEALYNEGARIFNQIAAEPVSGA